jgi:hypothetical protein
VEHIYKDVSVPSDREIMPTTPPPSSPELVHCIERAARYQQRALACIRAGRRPDGSLDRHSLERAIAELSAAIDCLREASELAEADERGPLEATIRQREEDRRAIEAMLRRGR